jgi:hypothetical protein
MFKKVAIIIIVLVYGLSSTGAIVHLDYCCGKLSNISLAPVEKKKADCHQDQIKGKSCCDSKQVRLSVQGEQETLQKVASAVSLSFASYPLNQVEFAPQGFHRIYSYSTGPPPLLLTAPLFIQHCTFRI